MTELIILALEMVALVAIVSIGLGVVTGIGWVIERLARPLWRWDDGG